MLPFSLQLDPSNVFFRCVEDSNDAIMLSDTRGKLVYVNPAWTRTYGFSTEDAIGETPRLLHSGMQSPEFYEEMWKEILDPKRGHWKGELINRAKDGRLVPVLLTITPYRDSKNQILGFMGISVDLSYKKDLEAKIAHQDRLASIGLLASGLAHEVGTPLGVVQGRAEFIAMQTEDPSIKKNLEIIVSQIERISKLIRSLLRISRSFSDVRLEPIHLEAQIQEVLGLLGQNLRQDSVSIEIQIEEGLKVLADGGRVQQVLLNLIMNSIHAIRSAISDGRKGSHRVTLSARRNDDSFVLLDIEDTGCGIKPENQKKLFKPFFTTKDVGQGTGLGLAIVAQLVHEMEGQIECQSQWGVGTTFRIRLRAAERT